MGNGKSKVPLSFASIEKEGDGGYRCERPREGTSGRSHGTQPMVPNNGRGHASLCIHSSQADDIDYLELESYKREYWLDPSAIVHKLSIPTNHMKAALGTFQGQRVFIKCLDLASSRNDFMGQKKALVREVHSLVRVNHPNIVHFVGFSITIDHGFCCLFEYMEGKTLRHLLHDIENQLSWVKQKIHIAMDIATALVYLHSLRPRIIHHTVKAEKILITSCGEAKLSSIDRDFHRTRAYEIATMSVLYTEDIEWSAPEVILSEYYTEKVDVYSFGVLLTVLDTREPPFAIEKTKMPFTLMTNKIASGELRPTVSSDCPPCIKEIVDLCLAYDASQRPASDRILQMLREARLELLDRE
ncbi:Aste57867_1998 [Aphanomyces stellatus]|uniref:Aste57867_1998 protein n=1 Tax=Aphanomyces stellatus TaxID=120398 RepID=A0A485KBP4_9STRA|nr:hypothetical protein As57867_001996 [Aphanomyces stellatus]VFT79202.1 Aste57867_1998 [Aphanomyces stellatus]